LSGSYPASALGQKQTHALQHDPVVKQVTDLPIGVWYRAQSAAGMIPSGADQMAIARRRFVSALGGTLVAWPLAVRAQQPEQMRRVGVLMPFSPDDQEIKNELTAFPQQLQSLGWTVGKNLRIDYRWSGGDSQKLQDYAKELVAAQPDVIFARGTPPTAALLKNTGSIPVVFAVVSDPVGDGFVASVARPGGNATGFTNAEASLTGKWLGLLKEITPTLTSVGFIFDPKVAPGGGAYYTSLINAAAASSGVAPVAMPVHNDVDDIERTIADFAHKPNGGLIVLPDLTTGVHRALIIALAGRYRLPAIYAFRYLAEEGGLMSYGVNVVELLRLAANYVDRILKGAKPADLPVQLPDKFEFVINQKTAKTLGIQIPPGVLAIADEVIE
jgi:putative tryptophan/tyrosine transport system substrate-binding protein